MEAFSSVNDELRVALMPSEVQSINGSSYIASAENIEKKVRDLIPIEDLRTAGAFFTGDTLAGTAISNFPKPIQTNSVCFDPACGVGNLLISASKCLPVFASLDETIELWNQCLIGFDLHQEFVECTKLRLIHEAISRGAKKSNKSLNQLELLFENIREGDALNNLQVVKRVTHLLLNPPYSLKIPSKPLSWGSGKINMAALFLEEMVKNASYGTSVSAILPDVLRSGSRYSKWRKMISQSLDFSLAISGKFDQRTGIDVINVYGSVRKSCSEPQNCWINTVNGASVGDYFNTRVGPLVAYRDKEEGLESPYIHPRILDKWSESFVENSWRKTKSKLTLPPFVVVNRTSGPRDHFRATATIIKGTEPVAVENHLIILSPKKDGLTSCRKLLRILKSSKTNSFLNERIRCRHLTIDSVKNIPWKE